jgi:predicted permease
LLLGGQIRRVENPVPSILEELRYSLRPLRKAPGFTLTAVLTLGVGIGTTTAIFTLVYDVLLRPLPFEHPEQLVVTEEQVAEFRDIYPKLPMNANHFTVWQQSARDLQSIAVMKHASVPLGLGGHPVQVEAVSATPDIFKVLAAAPEIGRAFTAEEGRPGHDRVVVLMNDLWRTQFQSDAGILGRTITLNGFPYTVIGVMPRSFHLPFVDSFAGPGSDRAKPPEALFPLAFSSDDLEDAMGDFNYFGVARLRPGVSLSQANAEINALEQAITARLAARDRATLSAVLTPFQDALVGNNRTPLWFLLAAVAGLLLVGCVNITNLLLSRAAGRRQQLAVAAALGAGRFEMLRMAMRETVVLAVLGCSLGIALAASLVPAMQRFLPAALDFRGPLHLDWIGMVCALALAAVSTLLAGAVPAWISSRTDPHEVLRSESRLAGESRRTKQLRRTLVAVEVAVSVALLLVAGLLTTSLVRLMRIDRGFDAQRVLTAEINLPDKSYADPSRRTAFFKQMLERLGQLPGLEQAGIVSQLPLTGDQWIDMIRVPGDPRPEMRLPTEHFRWVSPGYFEAIHLQLMMGRFLSSSDEGKSYALISERTARALWPGQNPIGRQFSRPATEQTPFTVIGVVGDARTVSLAAPDPMMVYVPYWYRCGTQAGLLARTRQDPAMMAGAVRKAIWSVDPQASVPSVRALGGVVADSVANRRFEMDLLLLFAASALLLAGLGVYGVVTYSVVRRHHEIGLRLALGAQRANIYSLVLGEGLVPILIGVFIGIGIAFGFARTVASLLFEVSPFNPAIVAGSASILVLVGIMACLLPARRAASVDPMQSLRSE